MNDHYRLTFAVCTNKLDQYFSFIATNAAALSRHDEFICVIDSGEAEVHNAIVRLESLGLWVLRNGANLGLSYSRNRVVDACRTRYVVFLDDDVTISPNVVSEIRSCFRNGHEIVGIRLEPPNAADLRRWFLSPSQFHYLGLHRADRPATVWGACMAFDVEFARRHALWFQDKLGRRGNQLQCGDDTTFLRQMRERGARQKVPLSVSVIHHPATDQLCISYVLRRAIWQGRSEVRRNSAWSGFKKEIYRNFDGAAASPSRGALAVLYSLAVLFGILIEQARAFAGGEAGDD